MVMRVGGIVSGMDIEGMVNKLMEAERMPLERMRQEETQLTWKRDAFREINSVLLDLDQMMLDMKLTRTYQPKSASSSQENAVRATAAATASNGSYEISVQSLATNEMQIGTELEGVDLASSMGAHAGEHTFFTYDENGKQIEHTLVIDENDTLGQVLRNIGTESGGNVRAFFDGNNQRVVLETTRTGVYNEGGREIVFTPDGEGEQISNFFTNFLHLGEDTPSDRIIEATNAEFTYNNGLELSSRDNSYDLNGITFEFLNVTETSARITVNTDVDTSFEAIEKFVNKYNEAIDKMNASQMEQTYRDYHPLSEEQKAEMTDRQIEQWEERAKSGILRGESSIRNAMFSLRNSLQGVVENEGEYALLSQIGIETTENYLDGGRLTIDEDKLRAALRDNPSDVHELFAGADGEGLIHRFENGLDQARGSIERQAGRETTVALDNYSIGRRMKELNERISSFEDRMIRVEQRYWNQFTQMEMAISRLNEQSSHMFSQFGGM